MAPHPRYSLTAKFAAPTEVFLPNLLQVASENETNVNRIMTCEIFIQVHNHFWGSFFVFAVLGDGQVCGRTSLRVCAALCCLRPSPA